MIKIIQLLCPSRHCFLALAFDGETMSDRDAAVLLRQNAAGHMSLRGSSCALCGSAKFTHEIGITKFRTLEEALPALRQCEAGQLTTRAYLTGRDSRN